MGICAKNMSYGDVAWRCMDCEKDPTCIICSSCFEKSDHTGHRVQLKRNVGGCCDCGDPEAWDPEHFCSDHKGYELTAEETLAKLPKNILESANLAFTEICIELKKYCLILANHEAECKKKNMESDAFKKQHIEIVRIIFEFLTERVEEVPAFLYVIDQKLNVIHLDEDSHAKNEEHMTCCIRAFYSEEETLSFRSRFDFLETQQK